MNDTVLKQFFVYSEVGSYKTASELLFVDASGISKNINNLENELGFELFTNINGRNELTREGEIFYEKVKILLNEFYQICEELKNHSFDEIKEFNIATYFFHELTSLEQKLQEFLNIHPELIISMRYLKKHNFLDELYCGKYDLIIEMVDPKYLPDNVSYYEIGKMDINLIYSTKYIDNLHSDIDQERLKKYNLIIPNMSKHFSLKNIIENLINNDLLDENKIIEVDNIDSMINRVENSSALGIIPAIRMAGLQKNLKSIQLNILPKVPLLVVWDKSKKNKYIAEIVSLLKKCITNNDL